MRTILSLLVIMIVAVGAYWYFGPISDSDAPYWSQLNETLPQEYRKPDQVVQPAQPAQPTQSAQPTQ